MEKIILLFNKAFIFLCLIGVLLASSNLTNSSINANIGCQNTEIGKKVANKKDFKLKPVSFEATLNYLQPQLQQFFYVNFQKTHFFDLKINICKLLSQNIDNQFKIILFSRIIPSQAP